MGKGGGYSDLELGLLVEAGAVDDATTIVTTVHPLQVLDTELPETTRDFRVDIVVTPDEARPTHATARPASYGSTSTTRPSMPSPSWPRAARPRDRRGSEGWPAGRSR